jgi:endonuclease YncB( thermonuclease family)
LVALAIVATASLTSHVGAEATTYVWINGHLTTVHFNDGDSFRPVDGEYHGQQCRLGGFNALESYGPVHQWGDWHPYELYIISKTATRVAQRGRWHCFTDGTADSYGRLLLDCPDLAVGLIGRGDALAMQIDDTPSRPEYLRAQQAAIEARRGMWAHGVPAFVMTSVHSFDEDIERSEHYNRRLSTLDGHTESMAHSDRYDVCQWVCDRETVADATEVHDVARSLRADTSLAPLIGDVSNLLLREITDRFARTGALPGWVTGSLHDSLLERLAAARASGQLVHTHDERGSCMLYVPFDQRYGTRGGWRPSCLQEHGTLPPDVPDHWHHATE